MSNSRRWQDRQDKPKVTRQAISISRDLLSCLSCLSSHIPINHTRGNVLSYSNKIFLGGGSSDFRQDRQDRQDKRPGDSGFLPIRRQDRFELKNSRFRALHSVFSCLVSVLSPREKQAQNLGSGRI